MILSLSSAERNQSKDDDPAEAVAKAGDREEQLRGLLRSIMTTPPFKAHARPQVVDAFTAWCERKGAPRALGRLTEPPMDLALAERTYCTSTRVLRLRVQSSRQTRTPRRRWTSRS